jgi:RNA polymerase sigma factor (sigma-70 family)
MGAKSVAVTLAATRNSYGKIVWFACQWRAGWSVLRGVKGRARDSVTPVAAAAGRALARGEAADLPDDRDAGVAALFDTHYQHLLALARRLLDDPADAEDVVMDAFVGLFRRWDSVRRTEDAYFYVRASVVNGSRNRLRRLRLAAARLFTQFDRPAPGADQGAMLHLEYEAVDQILPGLARRQREVLVLRYYDQQTDAEIAAMLGCSIASVRTHAFRGLHAVAERMRVM